jgi:hypothetical protein
MAGMHGHQRMRLNTLLYSNASPDAEISFGDPD